MSIYFGEVVRVGLICIRRRWESLDLSKSRITRCIHTGIDGNILLAVVQIGSVVVDVVSSCIPVFSSLRVNRFVILSFVAAGGVASSSGRVDTGVNSCINTGIDTSIRSQVSLGQCGI